MMGLAVPTQIQLQTSRVRGRRRRDPADHALTLIAQPQFSSSSLSQRGWGCQAGHLDHTALLPHRYFRTNMGTRRTASRGRVASLLLAAGLYLLAAMAGDDLGLSQPSLFSPYENTCVGKGSLMITGSGLRRTPDADSQNSSEWSRKMSK